MEITLIKPQWIDITQDLNRNTICWPSEPLFDYTCQSINQCMSSSFSCSSHCGTHIDAPKHAIESGKSVNDIELSQLIGPCQVIYIDAPHITSEHVAQIKRKKVLFKTRLEPLQEFEEDYCYISPEAAQKLVCLDMDLVGTDCLSVEQFANTSFLTHKTLLSHNVVILENVNLIQVEPGFYQLIVLPVKTTLEAAPARAILLHECEKK